jgi:hypothetical protein
MATAVMPDVDHKVPQADDCEDGTSASWKLVLTYTESLLRKPDTDRFEL